MCLHHILLVLTYWCHFQSHCLIVFTSTHIFLKLKISLQSPYIWSKHCMNKHGFRRTWKRTCAGCGKAFLYRWLFMPHVWYQIHLLPSTNISHLYPNCLLCDFRHFLMHSAHAVPAFLTTVYSYLKWLYSLLAAAWKIGSNLGYLALMHVASFLCKNHQLWTIFIAVKFATYSNKCIIWEEMYIHLEYSWVVAFATACTYKAPASEMSPWKCLYL